MLEVIQYISIVLEFLIAILFILIMNHNKKTYGLFFLITFAIYIIYDLSNLLAWNISQAVLYILFLIASLSALVGTWLLYKQK